MLSLLLLTSTGGGRLTPGLSRPAPQQRGELRGASWAWEQAHQAAGRVCAPPDPSRGKTALFRFKEAAGQVKVAGMERLTEDAVPSLPTS